MSGAPRQPLVGPGPDPAADFVAVDQPLAAFEGCGIEVEYAIVDAAGAVAPICDRLLTDATGQVQNSVERPPMAWSNELAAHVCEVKSLRPVQQPALLRPWLRQEIACLSERLAASGHALLPGPTHPWMDPARETRLWPHEDAAIYEAFDRIFDCRRHGWGNCQSVHLNLPFADAAEFAALHQAIRAVLPLIPGLAAASPYQDGRFTGRLDSRLFHYVHHCDRVAEVCGRVVPERIDSWQGYESLVYRPLRRAVVDIPAADILDPVWLNARGAIARFDRQAIEIRLLDSQECPSADLALAALVAALVRALMTERWCDGALRDGLSTTMLRTVLDRAIRDADEALVADASYLEVLGWPASGPARLGDLWWHFFQHCADDPWLQGWIGDLLPALMRRGPLARLLLQRAGTTPSRQDLLALQGDLRGALQRDEALL